MPCAGFLFVVTGAGARGSCCWEPGPVCADISSVTVARAGVTILAPVTIRSRTIGDQSAQVNNSEHVWFRQTGYIDMSILTCTSYRDSAIVRWKLCDAWLKSKEFHFISGRLKSLGLRLHWDCRYNAIHCKLRTTKIVKILVFSFVRAVKTFAYVIYILACLFRNLHIIDTQF